MASLSFSYRSKKNIAFLETRLSYRTEKNTNPISYYTRSQIEVEKSYWKVHSKRSNDPIIQDQQNQINSKITGLRKHVLTKFEKTDLSIIDKQWFVNTVSEYYSPLSKNKEIIPSTLVDHIPYYLEKRKNELKPASVTKFNVIKHKVQRMEKHFNCRFEISDINDDFKLKLEEYYKLENYSKNTTHRELGLIKTICKHANKKGIKLHDEFSGLKLEKDKEVPKIWLSFDELEILENLSGLDPHLVNSRDWLIISSYTGQRVSDFMRFNKNMLRVENGKTLIEFKQRKTGRIMTLPVHDKVLAILERRNGEFPHRISDQRYNEYIKKVCKKAGFNQLIIGRKQENLSKDKKKKIMRTIQGKYPKHELITSHIGRRNFASNYYGIIPTSHLMNITGHTTEQNFREYLSKSDKDLALETFKYF